MHIPIIVDSPPHGRSHRQPVTFGVPLPRGMAQAAVECVLESSDGLCEPADTRVLDRWPDRSVRWLLVDAQLEPGGEQRRWTLTDRAVPVPASMRVDEGPLGLRIDTGRIAIRIAPGDPMIFQSLTVDGREVCHPAASSGLSITDDTNQTAYARVESVVIEHRSRLRVSALVAGSVSVNGARTLRVIVRLDLFAGSGTVRVRTTVCNPDRARHPGNFWDLGDAGSVLLKDVSFSLGLAGDGQPWMVSAVLEPQAASIDTHAPFEVYQDSSGGEHWKSTIHLNRHRLVPNTFRGYRARAGEQVRTGLRATPIVRRRASGFDIGVAYPEFWQTFPKAIEADAERLTVRLLPVQYADLHELQGGEQRTDECWLNFSVDGAAESLDWTVNRAVAAAVPAWVYDTAAVDALAPLEAGHRALVDQAIEGPNSFEAKREIVDEFGWRHFGDIYGDHEAIGHQGPQALVSHYNNQYDPVAGFALQFLRTGDRRWRTAMDELARHVIDIDIYHTDRDKAAYNGGLFWHTYHYGDADTSTHRTYPKRNTGTVQGGGPSADHNYPTGLMLRYFLTGDEASREAAVGLARYVLNLEDWRLSPFRWLSRADTGRAIFTPPDFFGPARSSGNSLNALIDGHRLTGDERFVRKADQLVQRVVHPEDDQRRMRLDEPEYRWFYAMFLQALGKYLRHKAEIGQRDDSYAHGQASLLAYARWMAVHEYPYLEKPEKLEYPTETWAAQDIRKSDIFCHAAIHATGAERERFVERAGFFHRNSIGTLSAAPTKALARPVIVLLTSGQIWSWFAAHPGETMPAPDGAYIPGPPERFVSQRQQAERRAKVLVLAGAVGTALLAVASLVAWLR